MRWWIDQVRILSSWIGWYLSIDGYQLLLLVQIGTLCNTTNRVPYIPTHINVTTVLVKILISTQILLVELPSILNQWIPLCTQLSASYLRCLATRALSLLRKTYATFDVYNSIVEIIAINEVIHSEYMIWWIVDAFSLSIVIDDTRVHWSHVIVVPRM
jgi:hypothetical protein